MDVLQEKSPENPENQDWQWCLVGNIVEEHEYGEDHVIKYGSKQFRPNAKVYIYLAFGGMGHEDILVIGMPRHSKKYIEIVIPTRLVYNFRIQKVYKPAVLRKMKSSKWGWWGNSEDSRNSILTFVRSIERYRAEHPV